MLPPPPLPSVSFTLSVFFFLSLFIPLSDQPLTNKKKIKLFFSFFLPSVISSKKIKIWHPLSFLSQSPSLFPMYFSLFLFLSLNFFLSQVFPLSLYFSFPLFLSFFLFLSFLFSFFLTLSLSLFLTFFLSHSLFTSLSLYI